MIKLQPSVGTCNKQQALGTVWYFEYTAFGTYTKTKLVQYFSTVYCLNSTTVFYFQQLWRRTMVLNTTLHALHTTGRERSDKRLCHDCDGCHAESVKIWISHDLHLVWSMTDLTKGCIMVVLLRVLNCRLAQLGGSPHKLIWVKMLSKSAYVEFIEAKAAVFSMPAAVFSMPATKRQKCRLTALCQPVLKEWSFIITRLCSCRRCPSSCWSPPWWLSSGCLATPSTLSLSSSEKYS